MAHADLLVVAETLELLGELVVGRQDLDNDPGHRCHDFALGQGQRAEHQVGDAISRAFRNLGARMHEGCVSELPAQNMKMCADNGQQKAVSDCRHPMFDESAIHVLHLRTVARVEVVVYRHVGGNGRDRHRFSG